LVDLVDFTNATHIVEFGAGGGNITERILKKMPPNCLLTSFEMEPILIDHLKRRFDDNRLKFINDDAQNINKYLNSSKVDCIISSLPLANIHKATVNKILGFSYYYLKEGGKFIQYQYSLFSKNCVKNIFSKMDIHFELLNIPPEFIYVGEK